MNHWNGNYPFPYQAPGPDYAPAQAVAPPPGSQFKEGQSEYADEECLRWGDEDNVLLTVVGAILPGVVTAVSKQLTRAVLKRPRAWLLQFAMAGVQIPAGEVAPITVTFEVAIGCGQSRSTILIGTVVLTAATGYVLPVGTAPPQFFVPAADIQVRARVSYTPTIAPGVATVSVGCMAAPFGLTT
jgi:hypothetical protein